MIYLHKFIVVLGDRVLETYRPTQPTKDSYLFICGCTTATPFATLFAGFIILQLNAILGEDDVAPLYWLPHVHPGCLIPPWTGMLADDWSCYSCKEKVESYFKERCLHN